MTSFLIADSNDDRVASVDIAHEGDAEALAGAEADAHFIAEARTVVDLLLTEVDELRAQLARTPTPRRHAWSDRLRPRSRTES